MSQLHSLGYIGVTSPSALEWMNFAPTIFGMEAGLNAREDLVRIRWDDRPYRLAVHQGDEDRVAYLGWELATRTRFEEFITHLGATGIEVVRSDADLAAERLVHSLASFHDPFGLRHEIFFGPVSLDRTFRGTRPNSRFHTAEQGLGHAVLAVPDLDQALAFYEGVLGLLTTDVVNLGPLGVMNFLRCNSRHHSIALWSMPGELIGLQHLMVESLDLNEVGKAYDLVQQSQYELSSTLGRHTGDEQLSFYTRSPSGFDLEMGCDSIDIDDNTWTARYFDTTVGARNEVWGHQWQKLDPQSSLHSYKETTVD